MNISLKFNSGNLLLFLILMVAIVGVFSINKFNIIPDKAFFISLIFLLFFLYILCFFLKSTNIENSAIVFIVTFSMVYIFITFINSVVMHGVFFLDYFVAYLSYFYLIVLAFLRNKLTIDFKFFKKFYSVLVLLFLVKYSISRLLGTLYRPGIFTENNYELLFLALLLLVYHHLFRRIPIFLLTAIIIIFLLANSRSGIFILSFLLISIYSGLSKKKDLAVFFLILIISFVSVGIVIKQRDPSLSVEDIDRFRFFLIFLREIHNWNLIDFLFGKHPLTPLSYESCQMLSFYKSLFSYSGKDICYAVILHAYILRILFNHGIWGLVFVFWAVYKIILFSGYRKKEAFIVVSLLLINGLSVSSINSIFTLLGLLILTNIGYSYSKYRKLFD